MRILIFNELYTPNKKGGAEVSTQLLAESLVELGHEIHICTSSNKNSDEIINGVVIHRRKQHNIYWSFYHDSMPVWKKTIWHLVEMYNLFGYWTIRNIIHLVAPDVIHTNVFTGFSVIVWRIAKKHKIPVVHTLRDYYLMCVRSILFNRGHDCSKTCGLCRFVSEPKRIMSQYVAAVVGISHFILDKHINASYFKSVNIKSVIPNAVSISSPSVMHYMERNYSIGYLGRIHESKGIEYLIESFLSIKNTNYILQIGGDGEQDYVERLKMKYSSKKVQFLGKVNSEEFLKKIRLLVVPSLWEEPFGRVIIEAHACACPVLVSNRGGMPELINNHNGRVFDLGVKGTLSCLLEHFIQRKLIFDVNSSEALELYSNDAVVNQYIDVYNEVVQKSNFLNNNVL